MHALLFRLCNENNTCKQNLVSKGSFCLFFSPSLLASDCSCFLNKVIFYSNRPKALITSKFAFVVS